MSLRDEELAVIPKAAYEQGPLIKALDASNNKLEALDENISFLNKLQRLTLTNNKISLLNDRIVQLSKLRVLVRNACSRESAIKQGAGDAPLPPVVKRSEHERADQRFVTLPLLLFFSFQVLNDNSILELPSTIGRLTNLEHLNLENNQLKAIPESIGYMTRLQTLEVGRNQLTGLPETLGGCHSLEHIDAKQNQLEKLPVYIAKLEKLKVLMVDNNLIEELPNNIFEGCTMLHTLLIHKNPIDSKIIQGLPGFKEYNERRVQKYDKQIYGGAMNDDLTLDEGFDRETTQSP